MNTKSKESILPCFLLVSLYLALGTPSPPCLPTGKRSLPTRRGGRRRQPMGNVDGSNAKKNEWDRAMAFVNVGHYEAALTTNATTISMVMA